MAVLYLSVMVDFSHVSLKDDKKTRKGLPERVSFIFGIYRITLRQQEYNVGLIKVYKLITRHFSSLKKLTDVTTHDARVIL